MVYEALQMDDIEAKIQGEREHGRRTWDRHISFLLAAIGSAVGLGNIWRFPYLVSTYGGAPFLIPYFIILFFVGMPIMGMELSLGTFFQAGDADAFGSMNPRLRGIGVASIFGAYVITFYYVIILGYSGVMFVQSFQKSENIAWVRDAGENFNKVAGKAGCDPESPDYTQCVFNWPVYVAVLFIWVLIFFSIFKGVKSTGMIVKLTVPAPLLIILILIIRAAFLEGAGDGIKNYIFKWDPSILSDGDMWGKCIGQVFFSLGICMGVMTAYSSHNNKEATNVPLSEKIISLSDAGIAVLGGFAIYEILGYQVNTCITEGCLLDNGTRNTTCVTACEGLYSRGAFGLAFDVYPAGLATLAAPQLWGILFFGCLILLGIDSAFSLSEAMVTFAKDSWVGLRYKITNWHIAMFFCVVGALGGILYVCNGEDGITYLDIVDNYINNWGMVLIGFLECAAIGWVYKIENQYDAVGKVSVLVYNVGFSLSLLIGTLFSLVGNTVAGKKLLDAVKEAIISPELAKTLLGKARGQNFGISLAIFIVGWMVSSGVALYMCSGTAESLASKLWGLAGWHGANDLRIRANNAVRDQEKDGVWKPNTLKSELEALWRHDCFAITFGFLIKYTSYALLLVITLKNIQRDAIKPYNDYLPHQLLVGQLIFVFMVFLVVFVAIFPRVMYDPKHSKSADVAGQLKWMFTPLTVKGSGADVEK